MMKKTIQKTELKLRLETPTKNVANYLSLEFGILF